MALPEDYAELKYIETVGNEVVTFCTYQTVKPNLVTEMVIEPLTEIYSGRYHYPFYALYNNGKTQYAYGFKRDESGIYACMGGAESAPPWQLISSDASPRKMKLVLDGEKKQAFIDDEPMGTAF